MKSNNSENSLMAAARRRQTALAVSLMPFLLGAPACAMAGDWPADRYPIIVWQDQTPARMAGLVWLGITAGRVFGSRGELSPAAVTQRVTPLLTAGVPFYVENIATDFYAAYHRFQPDHPPTWAFDQLRALHKNDPTDPAAWQRQPSLSDSQALATITARLAQHVQLFAPYRPLFYSLGDETGIADLAAAWDFDVSPASLAAFRLWLRTEYGTLDRLNRQWDQHFVAWDQVVPMTTDQAVAAPADNFSAWADFKDFMDAAFAHAVRTGTDAVHGADPAALAGLEGAQIPGWGGYDYARLAPAVDLMEIYDSGNDVEIARALNPALRVLTTTAPTDLAALPAERARLWHERLLGNRGLIVWEPTGLVDDAGTPTTLGTAWAGLFAELADQGAVRLAAAAPAAGGAAILYSPASFRISWLLDRRADGGDWTLRSAETEGQDSALRASMRRAAARLSHLGLPPHFVSDQMLADGLRDPVRVLLLPHVIALSDAELQAIDAFVARGGEVLADLPPGQYDTHGRRRPAPPLPQAYVTDWDSPDMVLLLHPAAAGFSLAAADGTLATDIDAHLAQEGETMLLGLQRDSGPNEAVVLTLAHPALVCDLRRHRALGVTDRLTLAIGAGEPVLLSVTPAGGAAAHALACPPPPP